MIVCVYIYIYVYYICCTRESILWAWFPNCRKLLSIHPFHHFIYVYRYLYIQIIFLSLLIYDIFYIAVLYYCCWCTLYDRARIRKAIRSHLYFLSIYLYIYMCVCVYIMYILFNISCCSRTVPAFVLALAKNGRL